ncbi:hypothetical protein HELRODRAFT_176655 [Helobdella robusta]|uniref:PDZ domain-containing protein n=1 Tax=Helobdella robusta TaxID=6412 RepID=T1FAR7_HELRO|nr:hypothetical protein HELRODRAFT_176655 [Helobdella robusta]ESN99494.1 hypothetical protein HELRODRAFT_176655 [Helobdella robusta]
MSSLINSIINTKSNMNNNNKYNNNNVNNKNNTNNNTNSIIDSNNANNHSEKNNIKNNDNNNHIDNNHADKNASVYSKDISNAIKIASDTINNNINNNNNHIIKNHSNNKNSVDDNYTGYPSNSLQRMNLDIQGKLDMALMEFREMRKQRDDALVTVKNLQRERSLNGWNSIMKGAVSENGHALDDDDHDDRDDDRDENNASNYNSDGMFGLRIKKDQTPSLLAYHHLHPNNPTLSDFSPHLSTSPSSHHLVISHVEKNGPADGKIMVGDGLVRINSTPAGEMDGTRAQSLLMQAGASVNLTISRLVPLPAKKTPDNPFRISLLKKNKNDDIGLTLGCKFFVKEIRPASLAQKDGNVRVGDEVLKIQNTPVEGLSLLEATKMMEKCKEKMNITINKPPTKIFRVNKEMKIIERPRIASENVNPCFSPLPSLELLSPMQQQPQLQRPQQRPPHQPYKQQQPQQNLPNIVNITSEPREVCISRLPPDLGGGLGLKIMGGNITGIFISKVTPDSSAHKLGVFEGDMVDGVEMFGKTKEESVLTLLGVSQQAALLLQHSKTDYERMLFETGGTGTGDLFYIRTNFEHVTSEANELNFHRGELFQVTDTLHMGIIGSWKVNRISKNNLITSDVTKDDKNSNELVKNKNANDLMSAEMKAEQISLSKSVSSNDILKRIENAATLFRKKSKPGIFSSMSYKRPVVVYGPLSNLVSREYDVSGGGDDDDDKNDGENKGMKKKYIKLKQLYACIKKEKHALISNLDIHSMDRLLRSDIIPIVVYIKFDSKQSVKEVMSLLQEKPPPSNTLLSSSSSSAFLSLASSWGLLPNKPYKKMYDQFVEFEVDDEFTTNNYTTNLNDDLIYKLGQKIAHLQRSKTWVNEKKVKLEGSSKLYPSTAPMWKTNGEAVADAVTSPLYLTTTTAATAATLTNVNASSTTLSRSSSDPNILKSSQIIRYLPSYSAILNEKNSRNNILANDDCENFHGSNTLGRRKTNYTADGELMTSGCHHSRWLSSPIHSKQFDSMQQQHLPRQQHQQQNVVVYGTSSKVATRASSGPSYATTQPHPILMPRQQILKQQQKQQQQLQDQPAPQQRQQSHPSALGQRMTSFSPQQFSPVSNQSSQTQKNILPVNQLTLYQQHRQQQHQSQPPQQQRQQHYQQHHQPQFSQTLDKPTRVLGRNSAARKSCHEVPTATEMSTIDELEDRTRDDNDGSIMKSKSIKSAGSIGCDINNNNNNASSNICRTIDTVDVSTTKNRVYRNDIYNNNSNTFANINNNNNTVANVNNNGNIDGNDNRNNMSAIIAQARGVFNCNGGILDSKETGVKLVIPKGALPPGVDQEIFFKVCRDERKMPPLDKEKGETLLSPLVMCGPQGLHFLEPIEMYLPHNPTVDPSSWAFNLKTTDSPSGTAFLIYFPMTI